jgi:hypothetical protein
MFGTLTFYMLLAYAMLFLLATWIEHNHGYSYIAEYSIADRLSCWKDKRRIGDETDTFYDKPVRGWCCRNTGERNVVWITLVWAAVGSLYAIMAAGSWASMCDKLDTGLGRKISVVNPENELVVIPNGHACATIGCEATFASSFMWYALTVVWMLLPQVFMFYFPALTPANTAILNTDVEEQQPEQQPLVGAGTADNADKQGPGYYRHYTGHLKM